MPIEGQLIIAALVVGLVAGLALMATSFRRRSEPKVADYAASEPGEPGRPAGFAAMRFILGVLLAFISGIALLFVAGIAGLAELASH